MRSVYSRYFAIIFREGAHKVHYSDVIVNAIASQITSLEIVYSTVYSGTDQRKQHQSSASLAFVRGFHQWQVNSPNKWPVTRKMFPFDDVINSSPKLGVKVDVRNVFYQFRVWTTFSRCRWCAVCSSCYFRTQYIKHPNEHCNSKGNVKHLHYCSSVW